MIYLGPSSRPEYKLKMTIFVRGFQSTFPGDDDSPGEEAAPLLIQNEIWATEEHQGGCSAWGRAAEHCP